MNVVLDSHVEALAFNYLNFAVLTVLNNLWTWLALLTAALSYWRIRSTSGHPVPKSEDPVRVKPDPVVEQVSTVSHAVAAVVNGGADDDVDGVRKGKFTVYYDEDMQCSTRGESEGILTALEGEACESEWWKCWETALRLRSGESEKGWYTCQDMTELNGNVVRLWDGGLRFVGGGGYFTRETCGTAAAAAPAVFSYLNSNSIIEMLG